ncbi:hypothetical protein DFJ58DRAFT_731565 [Suillus subalutaceus]|uniref:uncharacterized protein n=1 Tax=Suillus subalutaceus TaxID=48586 RepID=UPI001B86E4D9|nr:uncharacterized protein DFJ58DRAFT_731565 [Suillus subalutaceus]KAG1843449.1 hypothetical protein DFJ58DRAFT_731565 [Suillus subalutaceus]
MSSPSSSSSAFSESETSSPSSTCSSLEPEFEADPKIVKMLVTILIARHGILHYHGQTGELATFQWPTTQLGHKIHPSHFAAYREAHAFHYPVVFAPQGDDIQLHLDAGWNMPFLQTTLVAFSMQFLHVGDLARVVKGSLRGELGQVAIILDGRLKEVEVHLQDVERHIIQMCGDTSIVCQHATNQQVEVSKYFLDQRLLDHLAQSQLQTQQHFEPPQSDSEICDFIEVLVGEHIGKSGVIIWFSKGDTQLWFRDIFTADSTASGVLWSTSVPVAAVQRMKITQTLKYTKERGYDVKPGDVMTVALGLECEAKGVVQSIDFPNARLTMICDGDHSLIDVPIRFVVKVRNVNLDYFKKDIRQEVFIVGGEPKGYRAMLYSLGPELCTVALHGQKCITLKNCDVVMRYGKRLNRAMLKGLDITPPIEKVPSSSLASTTDSVSSSSSMWITWSASAGGTNVAQGPSSSINPNPEPSTYDSWTVSELDAQNTINARAEKSSDNGPLARLMTRESSSTFFKYHAMLKVSPVFDVSLSRRLVSMSCSHPFCSENGSRPEGCVAAYCTSNNAGAIIKHYHIPPFT